MTLKLILLYVYICRDFLYIVTIPKVKYTNVNCLVSYKIMADRSEPKVEVTLGMCFFFLNQNLFRVCGKTWFVYLWVFIDWLILFVSVTHAPQSNSLVLKIRRRKSQKTNDLRSELFLLMNICFVNSTRYFCILL